MSNEPEVTSIDPEIPTFKIPPAPVRLGMVQRTDEICAMLKEDEFVDDDDGTLSTLTGEVLQAQRCQVSELDNKRALLKELQVELQKNQQKYQTVHDETKAMNRQLYLLQDNMNEAKKDCTKLENDICSILFEKRRLQSRLVDAKWKGRRHVIAFEKYHYKMHAFENTVHRYRTQNKVNRETQKVKHEVEKMQEELATLQSEVERSEMTKSNLRSGMTALREQEMCADDQLKSLREQIERDQANVLIMKKENEAMQKRDAAYVKRLEQQLAETTRKNVQYSEQNDCLQQQLHELKN